MSLKPEMFPEYTPTWHTKPYPYISPTRPALSMVGKTIIITGGGTAIGLSMAQSFAAAGATAIGIIGRRETVLIEATTELSTLFPNTKVSHAVADVTDFQALSQALSTLCSTFGTQIDIFISNAGYLSSVTSMSDSDPKDWWESFEVNVKGGFNSIRAFLPLAAPHAKFLNINTSAATLNPPWPGFSAYSASKLAMAKIVECLNVERKDIWAVNVHPGVVASDINTKSGVASLDDVALPGHFSVWLASEEAEFLKGKFVWVNWDAEELMKWKEKINGSGELVTTLAGL